MLGKLKRFYCKLGQGYQNQFDTVLDLSIVDFEDNIFCILKKVSSVKVNAPIKYFKSRINDVLKFHT